MPIRKIALYLLILLLTACRSPTPSPAPEAACGDGLCTLPENSQTCPADCPIPTAIPSETNQPFPTPESSPTETPTNPAPPATPGTAPGELFTIFVNPFKQGQIRPLLDVNGGPVHPAGEASGNYTTQYWDMGVRNVRFLTNGSSIDFQTIFPNPAADPTNPASFVYQQSDQHIQYILQAGFVPYLSLDPTSIAAAGIENAPAAMAEAVLTVVGHYLDFAQTYGGAITYIEIFNEPDLNETWLNAPSAFYAALAEIIQTGRARYPSIRWGGPGFSSQAITSPTGQDMIAGLLFYLQGRQVPLDFLSFHHEGIAPRGYYDTAFFYQALLAGTGQSAAALHLTEWSLGESDEAASGTLNDVEGAKQLTAIWLALQDTPISLALFNRGFDLPGEAAPAPGLVSENGDFKPASRAFDLWSDMALHTERLPVTTTADAPLMAIAGLNPDGKLGLLVMNTAPITVKYQVVSKTSSAERPLNLAGANLRYLYPDGSSIERFTLQQSAANRNIEVSIQPYGIHYLLLP